ncbi:DUF6036 family nucleotidyltransferase [Okibacterium fritillariae]|uniref:DUF6036 family nucleotidyltransferase n=1 Tax=Okibacterium fritillariae TaxID=123320 RepID=UPI004055957D
MRRADLEEAIRAATEIIRQDEVLIIGSQSILGSYSENDLPVAATLSAEVDIVPLKDDSVSLVADMLDGAAGEWSPFHEAHGFYIQGVGRETADLPSGWEERLVRVPVIGVGVGDSEGGHPTGISERTGLCLDPHDLCIAKLSAFREKDLAFVSSLIDVSYVDPRLLKDRLAQTDLHPQKVEVISNWLDIFIRPNP